MTTLKENIKISALSSVAFSLIWAAEKTYRVEKINYNPALTPVIYAVWHGWQYGLLDLHPRKNVSLLVSMSNDGEIIGRISKNLGYSLIRGSHGRGGSQALREILKTLKSGGNVAYTVDGPRGPIHQVKEGIIKIAHMSQVPIIPMVPAAKWRIEAKSWDKYQIPYIFTKVITAFGDPIYVPEDLDENSIEEYRKTLQDKLFELDKQAKAILKTRF